MKEEYHKTLFTIDLERTSFPNHLFIITAHNPFGEIVQDEKNDKNNTLLLEASQCEDHAEAGFGVKCSRIEAITLGKQFRQNAIYEICDDQVVLVDCQEIEADEMVGKWSELLAPTS